MSDATRAPIAINVSDHQQAGHDAPEVIGFSLYHEPDDQLAVNGFRYVIRIGGKVFSVDVLEGAGKTAGDGDDHAVYPTGGEAFARLIQNRHSLLEDVQNRVLGAAPHMLTLLEGIALAESKRAHPSEATAQPASDESKQLGDGIA